MPGLAPRAQGLLLALLAASAAPPAGGVQFGARSQHPVRGLPRGAEVRRSEIEPFQIERVQGTTNAPRAAQELDAEMVAVLPEARRDVIHEPARSSDVPVAAVGSETQRITATAAPSKGLEEEVLVKSSLTAANSSAIAGQVPNKSLRESVMKPKEPSDKVQGTTGKAVTRRQEKEEEEEEHADKREEQEETKKEEQETRRDEGSLREREGPDASAIEKEDEREAEDGGGGEAEVPEEATSDAADAESDWTPPDAAGAPTSQAAHPQEAPTEEEEDEDNRRVAVAKNAEARNKPAKAVEAEVSKTARTKAAESSAGGEETGDATESSTANGEEEEDLGAADAGNEEGRETPADVIEAEGPAGGEAEAEAEAKAEAEAEEAEAAPPPPDGATPRGAAAAAAAGAAGAGEPLVKKSTRLPPDVDEEAEEKSEVEESPTADPRAASTGKDDRGGAVATEEDEAEEKKSEKNPTADPRAASAKKGDRGGAAATEGEEEEKKKSEEEDEAAQGRGGPGGAARVAQEEEEEGAAGPEAAGAEREEAWENATASESHGQEENEWPPLRGPAFDPPATSQHQDPAARSEEAEASEKAIVSESHGQEENEWPPLRGPAVDTPATSQHQDTPARSAEVEVDDQDGEMKSTEAENESIDEADTKLPEGKEEVEHEVPVDTGAEAGSSADVGAANAAEPARVEDGEMKSTDAENESIDEADTKWPEGKEEVEHEVPVDTGAEAGSSADVGAANAAEPARVEDGEMKSTEAENESIDEADTKLPEGKEEVEHELPVDIGAEAGSSADAGAAREAEPAQVEEWVAELPSEPGCYLRTPSGCPNHPTFSSRGWRHDAYAENYTRAKENVTECEVVRKARMVEFCGAEDAETLFVPSIWGGQVAGDATPMDEGCYVRTPSGCPKHPNFSSSTWRHEEYGERETTAKVNRTACEVTRKEHVAHWCGVEDVELLFVPPPPPGCYVRTPAGCPNHPEYASSDWKHEEFGENFTQAKENRTACELVRRTHLARWCGTMDVRMLFIPAAQEDPGKGDESRKVWTYPTEPGCFMLTPSGCPNHPAFGKDGWEHDRVGELSGARRSRALCEGGRREQISHWCGTEEVEAFFLPSPEPGCYVRTPSGCPKHPHFGSTNWTHEEYGEKHGNSRLDRMECEVERKAHVMHWCGIEDVQMSFVPPDWDSLIVVGPGGGEGGAESALEPPSQPGCYVRTPSGCPNHPTFNTSQWKHEDYGERNTRASNRRSACETARKAHVAHWCGVEDVEMLFVPTPEPGCYIRTPSGCPEHPEYGSGTWLRDEGENSTSSQTDRTICEEARQAEIAVWCGAQDAETLFIPAAAP